MWISRAGHPLQARHRRAEPVPHRADGARCGLAATIWARPRASGSAGGSSSSGSASPRRAVLGALMAQDLALFVVFFDLMLMPFFFLAGIWGAAETRASRRSPSSFIYTLVGSLLMLAAAIATGVLAPGDGARPSSLSDLALAEPPAAQGLAGLDLPVLRRGVPGQDAGLPAPRLDARRLPRHAAAGAGRLLGRAVEGRRLRLPAHRAAAVPRRLRALPGPDAADRAGVDPLRLGDGVHDDRTRGWCSATRRSPSWGSSCSGSSP